MMCEFFSAKLIFNVAHHGWVVKKIFPCRLPKKALNNIYFLPFYLTEKHHICTLYYKTFVKENCIKELCKESTKKKKNMWNSAYMQKKIISAFIKTL